MNENAIELVRHAVAGDPHISNQEITEICYLSRDTIHRIIHEELGMKRCVQSGYSTSCQGHNKWRVRCAKQMLAMFEPQGPKRLTDVVIGDETFISFYGVPSKQANTVLPAYNESPGKFFLFVRSDVCYIQGLGYI